MYDKLNIIFKIQPRYEGKVGEHITKKKNRQKIKIDYVTQQTRKKIVTRNIECDNKLILITI